MKQDFQTALGATSNKPDVHLARKKKSQKKQSRRSNSPVTLRLTADERKRLETLADGMTMSAFIRACVFKRTAPIHMMDKAAVAQVLALLGQSRIANNLNQLAYQANIGALAMDERERTQIEETYKYVRELRTLLLKTLKN